MTDPNSSRIPAHELWVELSTRISSRDLHFRSGQEETAVDSIVSLFKTTRALMSRYPDAETFLTLASAMLETIRPYSARWHAMRGPPPEGRFLGPQQRLQFRGELAQLQPLLIKFVASLAKLKAGAPLAVPELPAARKPTLGTNFPMGIDTGATPAGATADPGQPEAAITAFREMNERERRHVSLRRGLDPGKEVENGRGLALSGGGIRSATFCLGVVQVLARAGLLTKFDYLSTVSGGGYLGTFLSNQFDEKDVRGEASVANPDPAKCARDANEAYRQVFTENSKDSEAVRHLRNHSKYLLPATTLDRLKLIGLLISGVLSTTLLLIAVPVFCALLVHTLARRGCLAHELFWFSAAGFGVVAVVGWLLRPITRIYQYAPKGLDTVTAAASVLALVCVFIAATPWVLDTLNGVKWKIPTLSFTGLVTLLSGTAVVKAIGAVWKYRKIVSRLFILSGVVLFVIAYLAIVQYLGWNPETGGLTRAEVIVLASLAIWGVWAAVINLNLSGLHRYYRDRLADCYLEKPKVPRGIAHPPPLHRMAGKLPYHLVNTTVNLAASTNPELRGRGGDFFLFSKHYCGSTISGYLETAEVVKMNQDLDLSTAMAISGAAASTNMGWQTMREYRTLMAIFNVRLGYWMRWPKGRWGLLASNAFVQLGREILGLLSEQASTLNLSDGGHIENLGVYELIRRKLKFIVCVDGGMDGAMECADLNRLQRLVAIDFGYQIDFSDADLKLVDRFSSNYGLLAKIDYSPAVKDVEQKQLGWMLYIKLAMLGTESNYVLDYRRENPLFPHQSTADQFFNEAQFEAYRKLGETAAQSFLSEQFGTGAVTGFEDWFGKLLGYLLRDTDPVYRPVTGVEPASPAG